MNPKIYIAPDIAVTLEGIRNAVGGLEFSGFGFCEQTDNGLYIYDFVLLDVGSSGYTEINTQDIVKLMSRKDAANMKVWVHRHPIGNGIPGEHNWSIMDTSTIQTCPLGGLPELVKWSASIVFTPKGWVGRIDNHLSKKTLHVEVSPKINFALVEQAHLLRDIHLNSVLATNDQEEDTTWYDDLFTMDPEEIEDYLDELDEDVEDFDDDEDLSHQDFLLSNMHVSALHAAGGVYRPGITHTRK